MFLVECPFLHNSNISFTTCASPEISKKNVRAQMDRMIKCAVEGTSLLD